MDNYIFDRYNQPCASEPKYVLSCDECGNGIADGEYYYELDGKAYCEKCMCTHLKTAEDR